jgi:multidrug resistance efflux pump
LQPPAENRAPQDRIREDLIYRRVFRQSRRGEASVALERQSKLFQDKANSPHTVTIQKATFASANAAADSAKAQLEAALLSLSYCHIVAPVDGIASQRSAEIGGRISVGQQLVVLVQTANVD